MNNPNEFAFFSVSSCSDGNSYILYNNPNELILIDAGVSFRKLKKSLAANSLDCNNVKYVIITHIHNDHIKGIPSIYKKISPKLIINSAVIKRFEIYNQFIQTYEFDNSLSISGFTFLPVKVPHDHLNASFRITYGDKSMGFISDAGLISERHINEYKNIDFLVIESNHSIDKLNGTQYPQILKDRILSEHGHLSNHQSLEAVLKLYHVNLKCVLFIHLSKRSNSPEIVEFEIIESLKDTFPHTEFKIAPYDHPSEMIII